MLNWLKEHFVPHAGNEHRPHMLKTEGAMIVLLAVILVEAVYLLSAYVVLPSSRSLATVLSSVLVDQTNGERSQYGLSGTLSVNEKLVIAAQAKADDMARRGYFSHNTPEGKEPWVFLKDAGYSYDAAGENLAVNFVESSDVTRAWMNSPGHRANILNGKYTEIGIATAQGTYKGNDAIFVVQYFGKPKKLSLEIPPIDIVQTALASTTEQEKKLTSTTSPISSSSTKPATRKTAPVSKPATTSLAVLGESVEGSSGVAPLRDQVAQATDTSIQMTFSEKEIPALRPLSFWEYVLVSPRSVVTMFYLLLFVVIALAMVIFVFMRGKLAHPRLVLNGLFLLLILSIVLIVNEIIPFVRGSI